MRTNPALRASDRSYDELVCGQTALWFMPIFCRLWAKDSVYWCFYSIEQTHDYQRAASGYIIITTRWIYKVKPRLPRSIRRWVIIYYVQPRPITS